MNGKVKEDTNFYLRIGLCAWEGQEVQFSRVTCFLVDYKKEEEKVV